MSEKITFTPEQAAAIETRDGPLLVSAAAGSGKTKVLVNRLLNFITDENEPCDISDFLIITYTRAAAAELRSKIRDEINARLSNQPQNRRLRRQATLIYTAHIGTIHSFCAELLRENAHLAQIPPDFRVADENECRLLKSKVLEEILEARYETIGDTPGFALLVDTMSAGRDDRRLSEVVLDAHTKLKSHAEPEEWVNRQIELLSLKKASDASETLWGRFLMEYAHSKAQFWRDELEGLLMEAEAHPDFLKAYGNSIASTADSIDTFISALDIGWDQARTCAAFSFPRAGSVKGYEDLKDKRKRCRAALKKLKEVFECTSEELLEDMEAVRPAVEELLALVLDFDQAYAEEKKKRALIDFSDQEHLTVQLLKDPETGGATPLAQTVAGRYREILVDEYQDVNAIQEMIFQAVSKNGQNIFMVGDVKQSIYRFRLADPSIFLQKYKSYTDVDTDDSGTGRRIFMSTNFRSKKGILDAVNFIFKNIMSESFGEMDYTEREYLYPGRADAHSDHPAVELDVLDMSVTETDEDEENAEKTETEASFVADRIKELMESSFKVSDGRGGTRPVTYGDFAILLRSVKNKASVYAEALTQVGIPTALNANDAFFESLEVSVALSFLDVIDNPRQDVPLITALKSPVYGFTPDELSEIRVVDKRACFYEALKKTAETDEKSRAFIDEMDALRNIAPDLTTDRLLFKLYDRTDMLAVMGAMRDGETRRENLMKLIELAARYEANGLKGLHSFMSFVRRLIENGDEPFDAGETPSGDVVRILSIHKSKGLEFPVVILADTAKRFNTSDTKKPLLMHAQMGVGVKRTDLKRRITYATLPRMAVAKKLIGEMAAEELRVLYVAMTRAREQLIIVSTFRDARHEIGKLLKNASTPTAPQVLEDINCFAGYILTPVLTRPEAACLISDDMEPVRPYDGMWDIRLIAAGILGTSDRKVNTVLDEREEPQSADVEALRKRLNFTYPYKQASELPSKLTATELKGRFTDYEAAEEADTPDYLIKKTIPYARPNFITKKTRLTATERGTALHLAMQYINYEYCMTVDGIKKELSRLYQRHFLTKQQFESINHDKIAAFFYSTLGRSVLNAENLYREFKFSLLVRAGDYFKDGGDDEILFQGVIDCCYEEKGKLNIIDFKTDVVSADTLAEKTMLYAGQVKAYGHAMSRITKKPVGRLILYFFATGDVVDV